MFDQTKHDALKLTDSREYWRPMRYPDLYAMAEDHRKMNWTKEEVRTLNEDISDFKTKLTDLERKPLEAMLLYFTQVDTDVGASYVSELMPLYSQPEMNYWWAQVIQREATHVDNYALLPEQFGIADTEYPLMLELEHIKEQRLFIQAKCLSGGFWDRIATLTKHIVCEGIGIYGIFLMLINYQRFGLMKCLGQEIVSWSARDENDHVRGLTWFVKQELQENPEAMTDPMREAIRQMFRVGVDNAEELTKFFFSLGEIRDLTVEEVVMTLKQIANIRAEDMDCGLGILYPEVVDLPLLPQVGLLFTGSELANFFETSNTAYGFYSGEWEYPTHEVVPDFEMMERIANG